MPLMPFFREPVYRAIKRLLSGQLLMAPFVATALPLKPTSVLPAGPAPEGLALIHTAPSGPEAAWIRQELTLAGFHPEFVPSGIAAVFGPTEPSEIYVQRSEAQAAGGYLAGLLAPKEIPGP